MLGTAAEKPRSTASGCLRRAFRIRRLAVAPSAASHHAGSSPIAVRHSKSPHSGCHSCRNRYFCRLQYVFNERFGISADRRVAHSNRTGCFIKNPIRLLSFSHFRLHRPNEFRRGAAAAAEEIGSGFDKLGTNSANSAGVCS
jgi:hypothetical protein